MDHTKIRRNLDIYVRPQEEDLSTITKQIQQIVDGTSPRHQRGPDRERYFDKSGVSSFAIGLTLSLMLLFLILVAQFRSFVDPFILLALPPGPTEVIIALLLWDTTLNVMSLMGVAMLAGIALSNSILIVELRTICLERA